MRNDMDSSLESSFVILPYMASTSEDVVDTMRSARAHTMQMRCAPGPMGMMITMVAMSIYRQMPHAYVLALIPVQDIEPEACLDSAISHKVH